MPCYEVRITTVEFKAKNVNLLKQALERTEWTVRSSSDKRVYASRRSGIGRDEIEIDIENSTIRSQVFTAKQLSDFSNQIKRAYSETVIDEVARKNKWLKKSLGKGQFQLQRF